jgi:hypothetical protein
MGKPFDVDDATAAKMKDAVKNDHPGAAQAILEEVGPCGFDSLISKTNEGLRADYKGERMAQSVLTGAVRQVDGSHTNEYIVGRAQIDAGILFSSLGPSRLFASYLGKTCEEKE